MNFRIRKGTHVSHFHAKLPAAGRRENFYEQDKPLWWGNLCEECSKLADIEARGEASRKEERSGLHRASRIRPETGTRGHRLLEAAQGERADELGVGDVRRCPARSGRRA